MLPRKRDLLRKVSQLEKLAQHKGIGHGKYQYYCNGAVSFGQVDAVRFIEQFMAVTVGSAQQVN